MGWTIFTAADLYIGLIVLDAMAPSIPAEKLGRLPVARKVILALLVGCVGDRARVADCAPARMDALARVT